MKLAWLTDIHLNFIDAEKFRQLLESVKQQCDVVVIGGDLAESPDVANYLRAMDEVLQRPVYFVLGNHDFYRGSIAKTRQRVAETVKQARYLSYLTMMGVVELTPRTAIVGHDGWADTRLGDYRKTEVMLSDFRLIEELAACYDGLTLDKHRLQRVATALADEAARHFETVLAEAAAKYPRIIAVTHVPPFRAAAWYQGKVSDANFLPYFACKSVGDAMQKVMRANPQSNLLVLCGHTHGRGEVQVLDNLRVLTGEAEYGYPEIQGVLEVE